MMPKTEGDRDGTATVQCDTFMAICSEAQKPHVRFVMLIK